MKIQQIRSILIKLFLGTLIVAAAIAVIAILAGSFGDVAWRSVSTIFSAMIHIAILFGILSMTSTDPRTERTTNLVINSTMAIAVFSFFTSILGIWGAIDGLLSFKLYMTYAIILVAILHAKALDDIRVIYDKVKYYVYANFAFIALVVGLLLGLIYSESGSLLEGFYGRLLAASAIVDVTLGIIVAVMQRLFLQRHPELVKAKDHVQTHSAGRVIAAIILFLIVGWPILTIVMSLAHL